MAENQAASEAQVVGKPCDVGIPLPYGVCCDKNTNIAKEGRQVQRPVVSWCATGAVEGDENDVCFLGIWACQHSPGYC